MRLMSPAMELKNKILLLENRHEAELNLLKAQFRFTADQLKPSNLVKSLYESNHFPGIIDRAINTVLAAVSGYFAKKIVLGDSKSRVKKISGILLQIAVTRMVAKNPEYIKAFGRTLASAILKKKEAVPKSN